MQARKSSTFQVAFWTGLSGKRRGQSQVYLFCPGPSQQCNALILFQQLYLPIVSEHRGLQPPATLLCRTICCCFKNFTTETHGPYIKLNEEKSRQITKFLFLNTWNRLAMAASRLFITKPGRILMLPFLSRHIQIPNSSTQSLRDSQQDSCAHGEDTVLSFVNTFFLCFQNFCQHFFNLNPFQNKLFISEQF